MTNEDMVKKFIEIEHKYLEDKKNQYRLSQTILTSNSGIAEDVMVMKKHQDKHSLIVLGIACLASFILGVTVNSWMPYASTVYDTVKTAQKIIPKG